MHKRQFGDGDKHESHERRPWSENRPLECSKVVAVPTNHKCHGILSDRQELVEGTAEACRGPSSL